MNYSYLNHVEAEVVSGEEKILEEAGRLLGEFFRGRVGVQSRAFIEEDLRYIFVSNGEEAEILEEEGNWKSGDLELSRENDYELIYQENGEVKIEEVEVGEAEAYLQ